MTSHFFFTNLPSKVAVDHEVPYLASKTDSGVDDEHANQVWRRKGRHRSERPSKTVGHTLNKTLNDPDTNINISLSRSFVIYISTNVYRLCIECK